VTPCSLIEGYRRHIPEYLSGHHPGWGGLLYVLRLVYSLNRPSALRHPFGRADANKLHLTIALDHITALYILSVYFYTRPAQTFISCGQLQRNLVCMQATWNSLHKMKKYTYRYTHYVTCVFLYNHV